MKAEARRVEVWRVAVYTASGAYRVQLVCGHVLDLPHRPQPGEHVPCAACPRAKIRRLRSTRR